MMGSMGALVTLDLPDDSPMIALPWIITFGPLDEAEEWEPVVCGPYERPHALSMAEWIVADDDLMAVVEPLLPAVSVEEIRGEITSARTAAADEAAQVERADLYGDYADTVDEEDEEGAEEVETPDPPTEAEVRAGFQRVADLLTSRA